MTEPTRAEQTESLSTEGLATGRFASLGKEAACLPACNNVHKPAEAIQPQRAASQLAKLDQLGATLIATVTVTELSGAETAELVADLLSHVESEGVLHFVFDLQNVNYMDSSCIGCMVEMLTRLQATRGRIALVNANQSVDCLFRLTRLDRVFPICRDVLAAIQAVEREPSE